MKLFIIEKIYEWAVKKLLRNYEADFLTAYINFVDFHSNEKEK